MRTVVGWLVVCAGLAACGSDTDGGGDGNGGGGDGGGGAPLLQPLGSCDKNKPGVGCACSTHFVIAEAVSILRPDFVTGCVDEGGTSVEVCTREGALGSCTVTTEIGMVETIQYLNQVDNCDDDAAAWQANCESLGGTWE